MIIANRGGHTKASCGAIGFINELVENRKVIKRVNELLSPYHTIVDCTPSESSGYGEWNIGVNKCNSSNAEIFFSIHYNAGGGKGCECVKHSTDSKIVPYANAVLGNLSKLGFTNRGIKNNDGLAETSSIKCPSMIIEVCFVDTKSDTELHNSLGVEKIARAIANGIDSRVSLSSVATPQWKQNSTGWWYDNGDGTYPKGDWKLINGDWYYFDGNGYAFESKWLNINGKWYWFDSGCKMVKSSIISISGKFYAFNKDGAMYIGEVKTDSNGVLIL